MRRLFLGLVLAASLSGSSVLTRVLLATAGSGSFPVLTMPDQGQALPGALVKYAGNPIIETVPATWESVNVAAPDIKLDPISGRWVMNYSGFDGSTWRTGLAYSYNLLDWTKEATNPVLEPNMDEGYLAGNGSIVYYGGQYWLYYQALGAGVPGDEARIYAATSSDMITWTRENGGDPVIDLGTSGQFDDFRTYDPHAVIDDDGNIAVLYIGSQSTPSSTLALATSTDGTTFTKIGSFFSPSSPELPGWLGEPSYLGTGTHFSFFADGAQVAYERYINRYWTTDGAAFTRELGVIEPSGAGWESAIVFDNSQVWWRGTLYVFYAGAPNAEEPMTSQIGVATLSWR